MLFGHSASENHDENDGDKHEESEDKTYNGAGILWFIITCMLFHCRIISPKSTFLSLEISFIVSGLFVLDSLDLSINIFLNFFGFCFTENVDWAWNNLRYAGHKVCLDHFFVDFDLLPLLLTIFCSLNIEVSLSNRSVRGFYGVLDVNELFWRVTYDLCLREDKCLVIKNRIEAEELELIIRFEFCF